LGFDFALAGDVSLPTSSHIGEQRMYAESGLSIVWGGRLKRLPDRGWTKYLRALEIQGDLGDSRLFDSAGAAEFSANPVLDYSLPYLNYESHGSLGWWLRYWCPFVELNLGRPVGDGHDGPSSLFFTHGLAFLTETYQLSAGAQIALNRDAAQEKNFAVLASILIFMEEIDPRFGWTPF
jgi:hypothetical protein